MLKKWQVILKAIPFLLGIFVLKLLFHKYGLEIMPFNFLFVSLLIATTFLIGFLISGVVSDFKESERIPGELACSLEALYDEAIIMSKGRKGKAANDFLSFYHGFLQSLNDWFYRKVMTAKIMEGLSTMNDYFFKFEGAAQPNYIARMKREQGNIRKMVTRVHTIRETSFVESAYAVVKLLGVLVIVGLLMLNITPFFESIFFATLFSFLIIYLIFLVRDLDNPFEYEKYGETGTEVSLDPLNDLMKRLRQKGA